MVVCKWLVSLLFFSCVLMQTYASEPDSLTMKARTLVDKDALLEAALIYEQIAAKDTSNYEASAFLGNYHFLLGLKAIEAENTYYRAIQAPNRMQMAHHMDELKKLYHEYYEKADRYIQRALRVSRNEHLEKLKVQMYAFKEKVGLVSQAEKKKK